LVGGTFSVKSIVCMEVILMISTVVYRIDRRVDGEE
jgi:hypothetical protein